MTEKVFVVKNETGLHARPASLFVQKAAKFKSVIKRKIHHFRIEPGCQQRQ